MAGTSPKPNPQSGVETLMQRMEKISSEFDEWANSQTFRNPDTGNKVKFRSLPPKEQARIYQQWGARAQQSQAQQPRESERDRKMKSVVDSANKKIDEALESGDKYDIKDDLKEWSKVDHNAPHYVQKNLQERRSQLGMKMQPSGTLTRSHPGKISPNSPEGRKINRERQFLRGLERQIDDFTVERRKQESRGHYGSAGLGARRWKDLSPDERKARVRKAFSPMLVNETEVVLPADVKRMSAERMRELGRALMISGTRAPRQQMVSIAATIDGLLEQLDMLGDQDPSLNALRRRVLMSLRGKVLGR